VTVLLQKSYREEKKSRNGPLLIFPTALRRG
jgi:hypothetical protein